MPPHELLPAKSRAERGQESVVSQLSWPRVRVQESKSRAIDFKARNLSLESRPRRRHKSSHESHDGCGRLKGTPRHARSHGVSWPRTKQSTRPQGCILFWPTRCAKTPPTRPHGTSRPGPTPRAEAADSAERNAAARVDDWDGASRVAAGGTDEAGEVRAAHPGRRRRMPSPRVDGEAARRGGRALREKPNFASSPIAAREACREAEWFAEVNDTSCAR